MSRILYIANDGDRPSGGKRVLYRHVEILCQAGFDAAIMHARRDVRMSWFKSSAPVVYAGKDLAMHPDDWVVLPEDYPGAIAAFARLQCRRAVFCQNHYYIFNGIPPKQSWSAFGISEVMVSSRVIRDFVRDVFRIDAALIPLSLDQTLFKQSDAPRKKQIAFMPRKGAHHIPFIRGILQHRSDAYEIPWLGIEGVDERGVAATLQQSEFFLSTGCREGFGLPPLEAMACGAIVVGFKGGGGAEFATEKNGYWAADEDPIALAGLLVTVLENYRNQRENPRWESMRQAGFATAAAYHPEQEQRALIEYWKDRAPTALKGDR